MKKKKYKPKKRKEVRNKSKKENSKKFKKSNYKKYLLAGIVILIALLAIFLVTQFDFVEIKNIFSKSDFNVDTILIKLNIPVGGEYTEHIKIINEGKDDSFKIYFNNLDNLTSVEEEEIFVFSGESKDVFILFKDYSYKTDVHIGELIVESSSSVKRVPIILGIEDKNPLFAITQKPLPSYLEVYSGEKLGMDIKLFNLKNNDLHNIQVSYILKNFESSVLVSETETLAIKDSFSNIKTINIPKNTKEGNYVFITIVEYEGIKSFSTYFFEINSKGIDLNLGKFSDYLIIVILVIIMLILVFLFNLVRHKEEVSYLKKQQTSELSSNLKLIQEYKSELHSERNKILEEKERKIKKALLEKEKIKQMKEEEDKKKYQQRKRDELEEVKQKKQKEIEDLKKRKEQEIEKLKQEKEEELRRFNERLEQFEKEKNNVVKNIKEKQKRQRQVIQVLKKKGDKKEIEHKLRDWNKERKEMKEIKKNIKSVPQDKVKKILEKQKKQTEKEFMDVYYSNLGKKNLKLD